MEETTIRMLSRVYSDVVRPRQIAAAAQKSLEQEQNGQRGSATLHHHGKPTGGSLHSMDVPLQGPVPELPPEGVCGNDIAAAGNSTLRQFDINRTPEKA